MNRMTDESWLTRLQDWWKVRWAVKHGISEDGLLHETAAECDRHAPQVQWQAFDHVVVDGVDIRMEPNPNAERHPLEAGVRDPEALAGMIDNQSASYLGAVTKSLARTNALLQRQREIEEEKGRNEARLRDARELEDQLSRFEDNLLIRGETIPDATLARSRQERGYPILSPIPWWIIAACTGMVLMLAGEAYTFSCVFMTFNNLDSSALALAWKMNPWGLILSVSMGVAMVTALLWMWDAIFTHTADIYHDEGTLGRKKLYMKGSLIAALGVLTFALTYTVSSLREATAAGTRDLVAARAGDAPASLASGNTFFFWVSFAIPIAGGLIIWKIRDILAERYRIRQQQKAFEQQENSARENQDRAHQLFAKARSDRENLENKLDQLRNEMEAVASELQAAESELRGEIGSQRQEDSAHQRRKYHVLLRRRNLYRGLDNRLKKAGVEDSVYPAIRSTINLN